MNSEATLKPITRPVDRLSLHDPSSRRNKPTSSPKLKSKKTIDRDAGSPPKSLDDKEMSDKERTKREMMMDLEDALKADAHNRVNDVLRRHTRVAHDRVLLCNGGLPPLVFAVVHGAVKSVKILIEKWSKTIDSTLLPAERIAMLEACEKEDHATLHNIVQDLYSQSYRRCLLVAAMNNENVEAARNTLKAIHYPKAPDEPELRAQPKMRRRFRKMARTDSFHPDLLGEDLIKACKLQDKQAVEGCLRSRANPNYQNLRGVSALMVAGMRGSTNILRLLIQGGGKCDLLSNRGNTVVHFLADRKHRGLLIELLESNHEARRCLLIPNLNSLLPHQLSPDRDVYLTDILSSLYAAELAEHEKRQEEKAEKARKQQAKIDAAAEAEASKKRRLRPLRHSQMRGTPKKISSTNIPVGSSSVEAAALKSGTRRANLRRLKSQEAGRTEAKISTSLGTSSGPLKPTASSVAKMAAARAQNKKAGKNSSSVTNAFSGVIKAKAAKSLQHKRAQATKKHEQSRLQKDGFLGKAVNWVCRSCMQNDIRALRGHLGAGYDVSRVDDFGLSAIHHAAAVCNFDMVKLLIKHKANLSAKTSLGNTVVHYLENNMPRSADILNFVRSCKPRLVDECYEVANADGKFPHDLRPKMAGGEQGVSIE